MAPPYREFASYILADLAVRERPQDPSNLFFKGNYMRAQYAKPVQAATETDQAFAECIRAFRKRIPRASDRSHRLALAIEALRRAGETEKSAALYVYEELARSQSRSTAKRSALRRFGKNHRVVDYRIGKTLRSRRTKRKRSGWGSTERALETIRAQASRYKRLHRNFEKEFENAFAAFCTQYYRDEQWLEKAEPEYRSRAEQLEQSAGPSAMVTAMAVTSHAKVLHELGKHTEAASEYRRALGLWQTADTDEDYRQEAISLITGEIERCESRKAPATPLFPELERIWEDQDENRI